MFEANRKKYSTPMGENVLSLQFSIKTEKTRRNERKKIFQGSPWIAVKN